MVVCIDVSSLSFTALPSSAAAPSWNLPSPAAAQATAAHPNQALNDLGILNEYVTLRTCAEHDALYESRYQDGNATVAVYEDSYETDLVPESATESA